MRKKTSIHILFFLLLMTSLLSAAQKVKEKDLPQRYQEWLKQAKYIMHEKEKEVFMQLTSDRDRDIFIETFWKQRDPTPGTPQNEYKDEILERFAYVNKFFKRGTSREGWMTDMGKFYMILGPPVGIERFEAPKGIYPCQAWSYYGDVEKGLPTHFTLLFWQRGGAGEFRLYDPVSDGPVSLLIQGKNMDPFDYETLYREILDRAPTLAPVTLGLIPGDIPFMYQPSPQNAIILADIIESPKKAVNAVYATHFLDYKGVVSTEYMTNFVESEAEVSLIQDPTLDMHFVHFSMFPKSISIDYYQPNDQYYCTFKLDVSLRVEEDIIFQYSKDFPFYFAPDELKKIRGNGISIEDSFPVIEGKFKLTVLLQNSVGKEFSIFEEDILVPEDSGLPRITGPFLGYKFQSYQPNLHIPYKVLDKKLVVDPTNTFAASDEVSFFFNLTNITRNLWEEGEVKIFVKGIKPNEPVEKSFTLRLNNHPFRKILSITQTILPKELSPDYYEMNLRLMDGKGNTVDEQSANFVVSAEEIIPHPIANAKAFSFSNSFLYFYMLAHQYGKVKDYEKAESSFKRAYGINPDYRAGLIEFANFLYTIKKFNESLALIENIKDDEKLRFEYYSIKGKSLMGLGRYPEAIESLIEGNKIYNSDVSLLNSLGFCYYRVGEKGKALDVLNASLRLVSEQKDVKELIEEIEKSRD